MTLLGNDVTFIGRRKSVVKAVANALMYKVEINASCKRAHGRGNKEAVNEK